MTEYVVPKRHAAFAVVQLGTEVLLVANKRTDGRIKWSLPGGSVHGAESPLERLEKEVREETGIKVINWSKLIYTSRVIFRGGGSGLEWFVEVHQAGDWEGELRFNDPDGLVVDGIFSDLASVESVFQSSSRYIREPIQEWLSHSWEEPRHYNYLVDGRRPDQTVERL